ncbi:sepiapterin reductase [Microplitis demolitor]|uniref:sepiapterin reductase n=1 Tax=Microplitis demolitor TaxID=69319 RepID=UPI0006D5151D|nr:sepiapterin reductase [Microplitis demolitor]
MAVELLSGKVFILITGASKGIGREIAIKFSELLDKDSRLLLLARDENGLKETAGKIHNHVNVDYVSVDLSVAKADQLAGIINKYVNPGEYDRAVVVHNVGSVGDLSKFTIDMDDFDEWRKYYDLNVFSPAVLNSVFMKIFNDKVQAKKLVINITSLCGIEPFKSMGYYCTGKAGREMYFKVFAHEFPEVNVLNYSPGPVETDMLKTIAETAADNNLRTTMSNTRKERKQLTTDQTVDRLIGILKEQKYKSGDHVDYFDKI